jgi:hypothetical protein
MELGRKAQLWLFFADENHVRLIKAALSGLLAIALVAMWNHRNDVIDAYTNPSDPVEFQLEGLQLVPDRAETLPSPYLIDRTTRDPQPLPPPLPSPEATLVTFGGGSAALAGVVLGPQGPVAGAIVRVERHTSDGSAEIDLLTDQDGRWSATGLLGGRFRVRSFVPSQLAQESPTVFFLSEEEQRRVDTTLVGPDVRPRIDAHHADEVFVGEQGTVAITFGTETIDAEGRTVIDAISGAQLDVSLSGPVTLLSASTVNTNSAGAANFLVACNSVGPVSMTVIHESGPASLPVWTCAVEPEPELGAGAGSGGPIGETDG